MKITPKNWKRFIVMAKITLAKKCLVEYTFTSYRRDEMTHSGR